MKTTTIRASVKITPKIKDTFYSFEYSEERTIDETEQDNIVELRKQLFDDCYNEVAEQIQEVINS